MTKLYASDKEAPRTAYSQYNDHAINGGTRPTSPIWVHISELRYACITSGLVHTQSITDGQVRKTEKVTHCHN